MLLLGSLGTGGCGKDIPLDSMSSGDRGVGLAKIASSISVPAYRWAVLDVTVLRGGVPVPGVRVEFARSVSGRTYDYRWLGWSGGDRTDADGAIEVQIHEGSAQFWRIGASGYYQARAVVPETGGVIGRWGSIPVNAGQRRCLILEVGHHARYLSPATEDYVREAVLRYMSSEERETFENWLTPHYICITLGRTKWGPRLDPGRGLLSRFAGDLWPARKLQQCRYEGDFLVDKVSGLEVLHLDVGWMRWIASGSVTVEGTFLVRRGQRSGYRYVLAVQDGRWSVTDLTHPWAS